MLVILALLAATATLLYMTRAAEELQVKVSKTAYALWIGIMWAGPMAICTCFANQIWALIVLIVGEVRPLQHAVWPIYGTLILAAAGSVGLGIWYYLTYTVDGAIRTIGIIADVGMLSCLFLGYVGWDNYRTYVASPYPTQIMSSMEARRLSEGDVRCKTEFVIVRMLDDQKAWYRCPKTRLIALGSMTTSPILGWPDFKDGESEALAEGLLEKDGGNQAHQLKARKSKKSKQSRGVRS